MSGPGDDQEKGSLRGSSLGLRIATAKKTTPVPLSVPGPVPLSVLEVKINGARTF